MDDIIIVPMHSFNEDRNQITIILTDGKIGDDDNDEWNNY